MSCKLQPQNGKQLAILLHQHQQRAFLNCTNEYNNGRSEPTMSSAIPNYLHGLTVGLGLNERSSFVLFLA
jgi:hypothetical protein